MGVAEQLNSTFVATVVLWVPRQARKRHEQQLVTVTVTQINDNSKTHVAVTNKHEVHYKN